MLSTVLAWLAVWTKVMHFESWADRVLILHLSDLRPMSGPIKATSQLLLEVAIVGAQWSLNNQDRGIGGGPFRLRPWRS
jgi:hypothetical protein